MAASDVLVASPATATGGILRGPLGTVGPTDATTAVTDFVPQGLVGDDGLTMTTDASEEKIRAWGGSSVRKVQTEHDVSFNFMFLETTEETTKAIWGDDNVTAGAASSSNGATLAILVKAGNRESQSWVFDMKDGKKTARVYVPVGQLSLESDVQFVHSDATGYEVSIEAFPDENGVKAHFYYDDGQSTGGE